MLIFQGVGAHLVPSVAVFFHVFFSPPLLQAEEAMIREAVMSGHGGIYSLIGRETRKQNGGTFIENKGILVKWRVTI